MGARGPPKSGCLMAFQGFPLPGPSAMEKQGKLRQAGIRARRAGDSNKQGKRSSRCTS